MKRSATVFYLIVFFLFSCGLASQEKRKEATLPQIPDTTLTLLFAGDLMQHGPQIKAARIPGGYDYDDCFKYVRQEIEKADIAIANLEVTLGGKPYTGYPAFSAPDEYLFAIQKAGFDVLTTANNHCLDRRRKGLERTILMLDSLRIPYAGTYLTDKEREKRYPLLIEKNNFRIAILNYTYDTNGIKVQHPNIVNYIDTAVIRKDIRKCQHTAPDAIIACMHWGIEYQSLPRKEEKQLARWLLDQGVTHIIGSHPHVVQPIEIMTDSINGDHVIAYSLGNYLSNQYKRRTDGGLMVKLQLEKRNGKTRLKDCSYTLVWTARPIHSHRKNYELLPVNFPKDSLPQQAFNLLQTFRNDTRKLLETHSPSIKEYFFQEKM